MSVIATIKKVTSQVTTAVNNSISQQSTFVMKPEIIEDQRRIENELKIQRAKEQAWREEQRVKEELRKKEEERKKYESLQAAMSAWSKAQYEISLKQQRERNSNLAKIALNNPNIKNSRTPSIQPALIYNPILLDNILSNDDNKEYSYVKELTTYENLTGISEITPEIIALTVFDPICTLDKTTNNSMNYADLTLTGKKMLINAYAKKLKYYDISNTILQVIENDQELKSEFVSKINETNNVITDCSNILAKFYQILKNKERFRKVFDLRDEVHNINLNENALKKNNSTLNSLINVVGKTTVIDLLSELGYSEENIKNYYLSTKVWQQLLHEYYFQLKYYSHIISSDVKSFNQNDTDAITLKKKNVQYFTFANIKIPTFKNIFNESNTQYESNVNKQINLIQGLLENLYSIPKSDLNTHICLLTNMLSKEAKYCKALKKEETKTILNKYSYAISNNNSNLWNNIIGIFPSNVIEVPTDISKTLVDLSYHTENENNKNSQILNFEDKYYSFNKNVNSNSKQDNTTTPGSYFYLDNIKINNNEFDMSKIVNFKARLDEQVVNFRSFINNLDVLNYNEFNIDVNNLYQNDAYSDTIFCNPYLLYRKIAMSYMTTVFDLNYKNRFGKTEWKKIDAKNYSDDGQRFSSIYKLANDPTHSKLKAMLFLYHYAVVGKHLKNSNYKVVKSDFILNTIINNIIEYFTKNLLNEFKTQNVNKEYRISEINENQSENEKLINRIKNHLLLNTTINNGKVNDVMYVINDLLTNAIKYFENYSFSNERSIYSGVVDTSVLMSVFDLAISIVGKFSDYSLRVDVQKNEIESINHGSWIQLQGNVDSIVGESRTLILNFSAPPEEVYKKKYNEIGERILKEIALTHKLTYCVDQIITNVNIATYYFQQSLTDASIKDVLIKLSSNLNKDEVNLLIDNQQIMTCLSNIYELKNSNNENIKIENNVLSYTDLLTSLDTINKIDDKHLDVLLKFFTKAEYSTIKAYNKKIMTVGIPNGFSRKLKQRIKVTSKTNLQDKQSDIINLKVYKIDLQSPFVVYKPQSFLFELSRYGVNNPNLWKSQNVASSDVEYEIPTKDFSSQNSSIYSTTTVGISKNRRSKNSSDAGIVYSDAFIGTTYDFLSDKEKDNIYKNHIKSMILEKYISLLSGIYVNEYNFTLSDIDLSNIDYTFFNKIMEKVAAGSYESFDDMIEKLKNVNSVSNSITSLLKPKQIYKKFLSPKMFDRVFNIIFDSDDFEVDVDLTLKNDKGKEVLEQMITTGELISLTESDINGSTNNKRYKDRDHRYGDMCFDKYFIQIETYGGDVI